MSESIIPSIIAIVIAAHGVGHMLFLVTLLGMADWGQVDQSWLITPRFGCYVTQAVGAIVWLAATGCFLAAAFGLLVGAGWWRDAAVYGSLASITGLLIFWKNPTTQPVISALAFDLITLAALLLFNWPPVSLVGA